MSSGHPWGQGGSIDDRRYIKRIGGDRRRLRKCSCGCGQKATHSGMANGVALMSGCEISTRRWVRSVRDYMRALARVER